VKIGILVWLVKDRKGLKITQSESKLKIPLPEDGKELKDDININ
jgi:hypothetical protein